MHIIFVCFFYVLWGQLVDAWEVKGCITHVLGHEMATGQKREGGETNLNTCIVWLFSLQCPWGDVTAWAHTSNPYFYINWLPLPEESQKKPNSNCFHGMKARSGQPLTNWTSLTGPAPKTITNWTLFPQCRTNDFYSTALDDHFSIQEVEHQQQWFPLPM